MKNQVTRRPAFNIAMDLVAYAARVKGVEPHRLARRERTRDVSIPRFGIVWVLRNFGLPWTRIAKVLNFTDHTSVIHAYRRAEQLRREDVEFRGFSDQLMQYALATEPQIEAAA